MQSHLIAIADLAKRRKSINAPALENGGKLKPAKLGDDVKKCGCGKSMSEVKTCKMGGACKMASTQKAERLYIEIAKASDEEQTVTGIVLQPEVTDGQGDIYDADVIKAAAYDFLANYNRVTKLGIQHESFPKGKLALVESYLAPIDFALNSYVVKTGSWIMVVKVLDPKIWKLVKQGKITGFSIGGKARVQQLDKAPGVLP